jgi:sterol desaturase/sphingolipid hydroxylase (fatty acid hydroxylase superfamily)
MTADSALMRRASPRESAASYTLFARAALVAGIGAVTGLYVLTRYPKHIDRFAEKLALGDGFATALSLIALSVPALVVMPVLASLVELLLVGWEGSSLRKLVTGNRHSLRDGLYTIFALVPGQVAVKVVLTFGAIYATDHYIAPHLSWNLTTYLPWWPLQYLGVVIIGSFFQYWQHRILHMVPALWETHKLHHSALEMNILNLNRESPFTAGVADLLIFVPLAIFGINESFERGGRLGALDLLFMGLFLSYSVFNVLNHYLIHSEIRSTYGWFGRWIFISPAAHRVHHSKLPQFWDKNFSVSLVIWDRMFGTWVEGDTDEARTTPLGFSDNMYNQRGALVDYFWLPLRDFARAVVRLARGEAEFIRRTP